MVNVKLSILIATYNSGNSLEIALSSIKDLSLSEWECIIIDGQSTDSTLDVIKKFSAADSRFKYVSEKDAGIYDALNKGVKLAKGEWVYVLGSDDEMTPTGLKDLLDHSSGYDVVYGDVYLKSETGDISVFKAKHHNALKYVMNCSHQAVIVKRDAINALNGFNLNYKIRADFDLLQRAYLAGYKFNKVNTFVAYFRTTGFSSMANMSTHIERLHICQNNKSTRFPLVLYVYQELKFVLRTTLRKV